MKKLFILLSILAITTPSYACGCGPTFIGEFTVFALLVLFTVIFPAVIVGLSTIKNKGYKAFIVTGNIFIWKHIIFLVIEYDIYLKRKSIEEWFDISNILHEAELKTTGLIFILLMINAVIERVYLNYKNKKAIN